MPVLRAAASLLGRAAFVLVLAALPATAQSAASIRIETAAGGDAPELGSQVGAAGDSLRVFAAAYNGAGSYIGPASVAWTLSSGIAAITPAQGTTALVTLGTAGTFNVQADDGGGRTAISGAIQVVPGAPALLRIHATPGAGGTPVASLAMGADSTLVLYAVSLDAWGNWTGAVTAHWSADATLARLTPADAALTVVDAWKAGTGFLHALAPGLPPVALPLTVTPGRVAALRVSLGPAAPAFGDTLVTVGSSFALYAQGFDAESNRVLPNPTVTWAASGSGITVLPLSGPQTLVAATLPGSGRVTATRGTLQASTGVIRTAAGALARVRISLAADAVVAVGPRTVSADATLPLFVLGLDAVGNLLGPVAAAWSASDAAVAQALTPDGPSSLIEFSHTGNARIRVSAAGAAADSTALITVTAGTLAQLQIEDRADGSGTELGAWSQSADSSRTLFAVGRDADGNALGARTAVWSLTSPVGTLSPGTGSSCVFDATHPGTAYIMAFDGPRTALAGMIQVTAGAPHALRVEDGSGLALATRALFSGESMTVQAGLLDRDGNRLGTRPATWTWVGDVLAPAPGVETAAFTWQASLAGRSRLRAAAAGVQPDTSGVLTVTAGAAATLILRNAAGQTPAPGALSADAALELFAYALDAGGNELGQIPVTWSVLGPAGAAGVAPLQGSATQLQPHHPGDVTVHAQHASGLKADAGPFNIVPGAAVRARIETAADGTGVEVGALAMAAGTEQTLYAVGRDHQGNATAPLHANWFVSGGIGSLVPAAGTFTVFTAQHPGTGAVSATVPLLDGDATGPIDVQAGAASQLFVESSPGDPLDPAGTGTWTADDSVAVHAVARDAWGNFVADVPAVWSWAGTAGAVRWNAAVPRNAAVVYVEHPGTGHVEAAWNGLTAQAGTWILSAGAPAALGIENAGDGSGTTIGDGALVAGDALSLYAVARDTHGNFAAAPPVSWSVLGSGAALDVAWGSQAQLSARGPGVVRVTAAAAGLNVAFTGNFTILAGAPAVLRLERAPGDPFDPLAPATLTAGDSITAFAVLRDAFGNWVADAPAAWAVLGTPGAAALTGAPSGGAILQALHPGSVSLQATWSSFVVQSPELGITAGPLAQLRIETAPDGSGFTVGDRALGAGSSVALHAVARDAYDNFLSNVSAAWTVEGSAGALDATWGPSVRFLAARPGTSRVLAMHPALPQARTGTFNVTAGTPAALFIERTPGDPADALGASALAAGDSLPAFAVWRDSLGNVVADAPADWTIEGTAGAAQLSAPQGIATVLRALHPGRVWLRALGGGSENIIGPLDIRAGAAAGTIALAASPDTLRADPTSTAVLAGGPVTDAWGNLVADGTRVELQLTGTAALPGEDVDAAAPGVQRTVTAGRFTLGLAATAAAGTANVTATCGGAQGAAVLTVLAPASPSVVPGSLTPQDWLRGTPVALALDVQHGDPVTLHIERAVLRIDDGNGGSLETALMAPVAIPAGVAARLQFAPLDAPAGFRAGRFAPALHLEGHDTIGHAFTRDVLVGTSSLHLFDGATVAVAGRNPARLTRGSAVRMTVEVAAAGDAAVTLDPAQCRLLGAPVAMALDAASTAAWAPGSTTSLIFESVVWPPDAPAGDVPLQLELHGTQSGGVFAAVLDVPAVRVEAAAALAPVPGTLTPALAPVGAAPAPHVALHNTGGSALRLDGGTTLEIAGHSAALALPVVLGPDSVATLEFAALDLTGLGPARWPVQLHARGTQNGAMFAQDLALADSLTLFAPNALTIVGIHPSQPNVTAGQTEPWSLRLVLWNAGVVPYQVDAATLRLVMGGIDRTDDYTLVRHKPLATSLAPAAQDTLEFIASRTGPDAGLVTLEAVVQATDLISGQPVVANTFNAGKGSLRVQIPALPAAAPPVLSQATVVENQANRVVLTVQVRNAGEAAMVLDEALLASTVTTVPAVAVQAALVSGTPLLAAGETLTLAYALGPFTVAPGPLEISAAPVFTETNRGIQLAADARAALTVLAAARADFVPVSAPARVTQSQTTPFSIRFDVVNTGGAPARIEAPHLEWMASGPAPVFGVHNPATFDDGSALVLPAGARRTLHFDVDAVDAVARTVQALPVAILHEEWSDQRAELRGTAAITLRVESMPAVTVVAGSLTPARAAVGQPGEITIQAQNAGEAQLALVPARSWARLAGGTVTHMLAATTALPGGSLTTLRFAAAAFDGEPGDAAVQFHLEGVHNGNAWSADLGPAAGLWLDRASSLEISAVSPSVDRVTRSQSRAWQVRARVRNHGGPAALESARLAFALGAADASSGFAVTAPSAFESGATLLAAGAADSLLFEVTQTADLTGLVVVDATVQARDVNTGASVTVTSIGTARGSVRLDTPAQPVLQPLVLSQTRVSAGQRGTWLVQGSVQNDGGSRWTPDWTQLALVLGSAADDSTVARPPAAVRALDAGEQEAFAFEILRTGLETGMIPVRAALTGVQETDGTRIAAAAHAAAQLQVQTPPQVHLDAVIARTLRPGLANTGQTIGVDVALTNQGEAGLGVLTVALHADGAFPADTLLTTAVAGGAPVVFQPRLRLRSDAGPVALTVSAVEARDVNDSTQTQAWTGAQQGVCALRAETPGALQLTVVPSQPRVSAGQTTEWWITVSVRNTGDEPLLLHSPRASDLELHRGGVVQNDYIVLPPAGFDGGGTALAGGGEGALRYRVTRTGEAGGTILLTATAQAAHANEPASAPAEGNGTGSVDVDAVAGLRILSTESRTYRRDHGFDDFRVNAGQNFRILVGVENTGGTVLDSIVVDVGSQRGNSQIDGPQRLDALQPGQRAELEIPVIAGTWLSQPGLPESFTASVRPARDHNSGLTVLPGAALDAGTFAYVESPARLVLSGGIESPEGAEDGVLAGGQTFIFGARLQNEGGAGVADNARVALTLPAGYDLLEGDPERFALLDTPVRWTLRAPQTDRAPGDSIRVALSAVPADANSGAAAAVRVGSSASPVEVHAAGELEAQLFPESVPAALRGVVSTGQTLDLGILVRGDADLVERNATLQLPAGWTPAPGTPPKIDLPPGAEARASTAVRVGAQTGTARIVLLAVARNRNDDTVHAGNDTLELQVQRAARLALDARIVSPAEAQDGRLLPGQQFQVQAWVRNQGESGLAAAPGEPAHGTLRMVDLPAGWTVDAPEQPFEVLTAQAVLTWNVTAPPVVRSGAAALRIVFGRIPLDANTLTSAGVDPDSSTASCVVSLANDAVRVDATPAALPLAAPGQKGIPLLQLVLHNQAESPVQLGALGVESYLDGAVAAGVFDAFELQCEGASMTPLRAVVSPNGTTWIDAGAAGGAAWLAAGASAVWTLRADVGARAAGHTLGVAVRDHQTGAALVRVVEAGSGTPVPVSVDAAQGLASHGLRVLEAGISAYNAPNPFHAGRELTQIFYRADSDAEVGIRIFTLQGDLVWETRQHDSTPGAALRSLAWDGRNGAGEWVRNGVYVCTVQAGAQTSRFKIAVAR